MELDPLSKHAGPSLAPLTSQAGAATVCNNTDVVVIFDSVLI